MNISSRKKMRVFDLLTTSSEEIHPHPKSVSEDKFDFPESRRNSYSIKDKIDQYSDYDLAYDQIAMPEIEVEVYFVDKEKRLGSLDTVAKVKRVLRYHHLARSRVDEKDYPANQEYFLYSDGKVN